jgi:hypothetical protein
VPSKKQTDAKTESNVAPTEEAVAEMMTDVKVQRDALDAQLKDLKAQEKAARDARKALAKPAKTLEEVENEQAKERVDWAIGYVITRMHARERAGQLRSEALMVVLDNLATCVMEELLARETRKADASARRELASHDDESELH